MTAPRIRRVPQCRGTRGPVAAELATRVGLTPLQWQRTLLNDALSLNDKGQLAIRQLYVVVPRQNGKTVAAEQLLLAGAFLLNKPLQVYTAHQQRTADELFHRMQQVIRSAPSLGAQIAKMPSGHGTQSIHLTSGARILFVTRSAIAARGYSADTLFLDESQELTDAQLEALLPTTVAVPGSQVIALGTAPEAGVATVLGRIRHEILAEKTPTRRGWVEWSAAVDDPVDDDEVLIRANPAVADGVIDLDDLRTHRSTIRRDGFVREYLAVSNWARNDATWSIVSEASWTAAASTDWSTPTDDPVWFAVDVSPDLMNAAICAAWYDGDQPWVVPADYRPGHGTGWLPKRLEELAKKYRGAKMLWRDNGVPLNFVGNITTVTGSETRTACTTFADALRNQRLRHSGDKHLTEAVARSQVAYRSDGWTVSGDHAALLNAAALAASQLLRTPAPYPILASVAAPVRSDDDGWETLGPDGWHDSRGGWRPFGAGGLF